MSSKMRSGGLVFADISASSLSMEGRTVYPRPFKIFVRSCKLSRLSSTTRMLIGDEFIIVSDIVTSCCLNSRQDTRILEIVGQGCQRLSQFSIVALDLGDTLRDQARICFDHGSL